MSAVAALLLLLAAALRPGAPKILRRRFFHAKDYALNDDLAGVRAARRLRFLWIDLNIHVTADRQVVVTHWRRPMKDGGWYDPLGVLDRDTPVDEMTFAQLSRLRHRRRRGARIRRLSTLLRACRRLGIRPELEAKDSPALTEVAVWEAIADLLRETGVRAEVKAIVGLGRGWERLDAARRAGLTAFPIRTTAAAAREHGYTRYRP